MSAEPGSCTRGQVEEELWATGVDPYYREIFKYFYVRINDHQRTEDLVQTTFEIFLRQIDKFDSRRSLLPWLRGIAQNVLNDYLRDLRREMSILSLEENMASLESRDAFEKTLLSSIKENVPLTPLQYRIVKVALELGYKPKDIAEALGVPADKVRRELHRAREKIKKWLGRDDLIDH